MLNNITLNIVQKTSPYQQQYIFLWEITKFLICLLLGLDEVQHPVNKSQRISCYYRNNKKLA